MSTVGTRRSARSLAGIVVLVIVFVFVALNVMPDSAQAQNAGRRWEYAELSYSNSAGLGTGGQFVCRWEDPVGVTESVSFTGLARKLGGSTNRNDSTAILNLLGARGWELAGQSAKSVATSSAGIESMSWTLKRLK